MGPRARSKRFCNHPASADSAFDVGKRRCHIRLDVAGKDLDHAIAASSEPGALLGARLGGGAGFVDRHEVDDEPQWKRHEVADVLADWRLALEAAAGAAAVADQRLPSRG